MYKKHLFIIKDNLTEYSSFFGFLKENSPFSVSIMDYSSFHTEENMDVLCGYNTNDVAIVLDMGLYNSRQKEIHEYLRDAYNTGFGNIVLINCTGKAFTNEDILLGKMHCYYLQKNDNNREILAHNFILYLIKVFNECILSTRLVDYITTSFDSIVSSELLKKKKGEIEDLNKELEKKNKTDSLTLLYNRQAIFDFLDKESKRTARDIWRLNSVFKSEGAGKVINYRGNYDSEPIGDLLDHLGVFSVLMIDVDHFKIINDTHGHLVGDKVLKTIGALMQDPNIFRDSDILGRFGGEEFICILPSTNVNNALGPAVRFMKEIRKKRFKGENNISFGITVSIGVSEYHPNDRSKEEIIHRADKALYWAKEHGRDQIAVYEKLF